MKSMKYENSRPGTESRTGFFYEIGADFASSSTRNSRQLMYLNCVRSVFIWEKAALQLVCSCSSGLEMNILPKKTAPGVWLKGCKYFAVRCGRGGCHAASHHLYSDSGNHILCIVPGPLGNRGACRAVTSGSEPGMKNKKTGRGQNPEPVFVCDQTV